MSKSRVIPIVGFFIALLPILGFPHTWEIFFQVVGGLGIVALYIMISVDKRLMQKSKAEKRLITLRKKSEAESQTYTEDLSKTDGEIGQ